MTGLEAAWAKGKAALLRVKWALWLVVAAVFAAVTWVLHRLFLAPPEIAERPTPDPLRAVRAKADEADERALVVRAQAQATAEAHREELGRIMQQTDGATRRRDLADFLQRLPP